MAKNKVYEGKVTFDRTSDTGNPSHDFDYMIGHDIVRGLDDVVRYYEGQHIRLTIQVEVLEPEENEDD